MNSGLERIEELTKRVSHLTGEDHSHLVRLWLSQKPKDRDQLLSQLELKWRRLTEGQEDLWLEPIPPDKIHGDMSLGTVLAQNRPIHEFTWPTDHLLRHVTIFGHSGSGKTNLGYLILQHLLEKKVPFMVFDWKRNYRDLLALNKDQFVHVHTVGRGLKPFYLNPLIPPSGTSPEVWLKKITEIVARAYFVGEGVMSILHRGIDAVYETFGVYSGTVERWPTFDDVKIWIDEYVRKASHKELKAQWIASTQRTLQSLCYGEMGRVLNTDLPTHVERLLDQPVILELDALAENEKTLVVQTLLLWIHHYRLQEPEREKLKHVILIEEAHHVLRRDELTAKESILDVVLREIRELGEGIIMMDQSPAQFSQNAIGNSATSFVFALKDRADVMSAANFLLLDTDQKGYLHQLPVGTCIVRLQDQYRKPFIIRLPHVRIPKGAIADDALLTHQQMSEEKIEELPGVARKFAQEVRALSDAVKDLKGNPELIEDQWSHSDEDEESGFVGSSSGDSDSLHPSQADSGVIRVSRKTDNKVERLLQNLDDFQILFLKDVLERPFAGISSRYERLKISTERGTRIKESLEQQGLISIVPVNKGDSLIKLANLTPLGRALVRHAFPDGNSHAQTPEGRNGMEHRYWKDRVARALEKEGLHVEQEKRTNGDRVDVHAENGHTLAVEVETGKSNITKNINKTLAAGYDDILLLPTNQKARRKVHKAVRPPVGHQD